MTSALDLAREGLYRFLAAALTDPRHDGFALVTDLARRYWLDEATELVREDAAARPAAPGFGELSPDDLCLKEVFAEADRGVAHLTAEYDRVFGLTIAAECPPFETEFCPPNEPFYRSQQLADVAGFYRAFGVQPPRAERPDHIRLELEFMAFLLLKQRLAEGKDAAGVCGNAARKFFAEHLAWWLPAFAAGLRRRAGGGFYAAVARLLAALVPVERARFDVAAPRLPLQSAAVERQEEEAGCAGCPAGA
jgi:TorA maturation chaperone TorD